MLQLTINKKEWPKELKETIVKELKSVMNPKFISDDWAVRVAYSRDQVGGGGAKADEFAIADLVVLPSSVEEVSNICKIALKYKVKLMPVSTGANVCGAALPIYGGIMMDFKRMNRILEIDLDGLTATVEPYVPYCRLQAELQARGYRVCVPGAPNSGSVLANNFFVGDKYFSAKFGYGPLEIEGAEIILPNGKIIRTGTLGHHPAEVKTEYIIGKHPEPKEDAEGRVCVSSWGPDLTGLPYQGVGGTGLVTKITVKIYPVFPKKKTMLFGYKNLKDVVNVMAEINGQDIGYGANLSGPMYSVPAMVNSKEDTEYLMELFENPFKAVKKIGVSFMKNPMLIRKKAYREVIRGMLGIKARNFSLQVMLEGTKRKVELDEKKAWKIVKDPKNGKAGNGNGFSKHIYWEWNQDEGGNSDYIWDIFTMAGIKHLPKDWFARMGRMLDYNETPTRIMRKEAGFLLQSPRMPYGRMVESFEIFLKALKDAGIPNVDKGNWSTWINSGAQAHYACLEFDIIYNPRDQVDRDRTMKTIEGVTLKLLNQGVFFPHTPKLLRDMVEKTVMPTAFEITKSIRDNLQMTVLHP